MQKNNVAWKQRYIDYAQALIDALNIRNELSHDYDGKLLNFSEMELRNEIFPAIEKIGIVNLI